MVSIIGSDGWVGRLREQKSRRRIPARQLAVALLEVHIFEWKEVEVEEDEMEGDGNSFIWKTIKQIRRKFSKEVV